MTSRQFINKTYTAPVLVLIASSATAKMDKVCSARPYLPQCQS